MSSSLFRAVLGNSPNDKWINVYRRYLNRGPKPIDFYTGTTQAELFQNNFSYTVVLRYLSNLSNEERFHMRSVISNLNHAMDVGFNSPEDHSISGVLEFDPFNKLVVHPDVTLVRQSGDYDWESLYDVRGSVVFQWPFSSGTALFNYSYHSVMHEHDAIWFGASNFTHYKLESTMFDALSAADRSLMLSKILVL